MVLSWTHHEGEQLRRQIFTRWLLLSHARLRNSCNALCQYSRDARRTSTMQCIRLARALSESTTRYALHRYFSMWMGRAHARRHGRVQTTLAQLVDSIKSLLKENTSMKKQNLLAAAFSHWVNVSMTNKRHNIEKTLNNRIALLRLTSSTERAKQLQFTIHGFQNKNKLFTQLRFFAIWNRFIHVRKAQRHQEDVDVLTIRCQDARELNIQLEQELVKVEGDLRAARHIKNTLETEMLEKETALHNLQAYESA
eukprot:PhM_4_TR724/c0_g1_i1/m.48000